MDLGRSRELSRSHGIYVTKQFWRESVQQNFGVDERRG